MHPADDVVAAMAADDRSAVTAASGRLQFTVRRFERGNVDLGHLIEELHDLELHIRPVSDPVAAIEAITSRPGDTRSPVRQSRPTRPVWPRNCERRAT